MLWRRCSNVVATSWQRWRATLSQRRKLTSVQLLFSTVPQRCDNVNNDVVTTLSQCRCASWVHTHKYGKRYSFRCSNCILLSLLTLLKSYIWTNWKNLTMSHVKMLHNNKPQHFPLVFIYVQSCSLVLYSCFACAHLCSPAFTRILTRVLL